MKTLKELLIIVRDAINTPEWKEEHYGLCPVIFGFRYMLIPKFNLINNLSYEEKRKLSEFFKKTLPNRKYLSNGDIIGDDANSPCGFCWPPKDPEPRINWLNKQINKL